MGSTYTELKMVTDRTAEDVAYALSLQEKGWAQLTEAQKKEWLAGLKGCLNAADLSRIEAALTELSALLEEPLTWSQHVPSVPDKRYFKELSENLARLRNHREYLYTGTPALPHTSLEYLAEAKRRGTHPKGYPYRLLGQPAYRKLLRGNLCRGAGAVVGAGEL